MDKATIIERIGGLDGVVATTATHESGAPEIAWGDTFFIYDPDAKLTGAQQFPFATIVTKDYGDFDCASKLDRVGVFRLNVGVSGEEYERLFGTVSPEHLAGGGRDFSAGDTLLPHPVYARQHWVCVLNPSSERFDREVWPLIVTAHQRAAERYRRRRDRDAEVDSAW